MALLSPQIPISIIPSSSRNKLRFFNFSRRSNGIRKWTRRDHSSAATNPPLISISSSRFKCFSRNQIRSESELEFERLFSNLNQATFKREPGSSLHFHDYRRDYVNFFRVISLYFFAGSLSSAVFLVAGTTVSKWNFSDSNFSV